MHVSAEVLLACEQHRAGRVRDAEQAYRAALQRCPGDPAALHLLGLLKHQSGDDQAAADLIGRAIAAAPKTAVFHANLGVVLISMRRMQDAAACLRTAVRLKPDDFGAQSNLGVALSATGDHDGAVKAAGAALRIRPGDPDTLRNRQDFHEKAGQYVAALADADAAIKASGDNHGYHLARGGLLLAMGRVPEALAAMDRAIELAPGRPAARQARIGATNYLPGATMRDIGALARRLAPAAPMPAPAGFAGLDRSAERRLRIGYVSGDFHNHPVGYFLEATLAARDRAVSSVTCYSNRSDEDAMTGRLRAASDEWRNVARLSDDDATALIRADKIDILVDLAGYTKRNRLGMFARRSAPVQAAWLGYFGTTGIAQMDYVIADRHVLPPSDEAAFTETPVRLPDSYLCFTPPCEAGPVAPLPGGLDKPVTFGCFNNRAKLNDSVFALWARVLRAVPGSRLLLKSAQYQDKLLRREIAQAFAALGIATERVRFEGASPIAAMFEAYGKVDIALDPFPFAGGATTAQALWMGVPVISLTGQTWPGRQGKSLLAAAGFPGWAVSDEDSYVALAQQMAADRPALLRIRQGLRQAMADSPLCQAERFACNLDQAYRAMWRRYLDGTA